MTNIETKILNKIKRKIDALDNLSFLDVKSTFTYKELINFTKYELNDLINYTKSFEEKSNDHVILTSKIRDLIRNYSLPREHGRRVMRYEDIPLFFNELERVLNSKEENT